MTQPVKPKKKFKKKKLKSKYLGGNIENCCGYCKLHRRSMTVKQMRARQCREKECHHFLKIITHPFWETKEKKKCNVTNVCDAPLPASAVSESRTAES